MPAVNNYTAPPADEIPKDYYGPDPFDVNFCFPVEKFFDQLESDHVKLVPFVPRVHALPFTEAIAEKPETMQWLPVAPTTLEQFLPFFERTLRRDSTLCTFAIIDKLRPDPKHPDLGGGLAGMMSLMAASPGNLSVEIGWIVILPKYQRSYVQTHASSLLLKLALEVAPKGLGLRRVQWCTHSKNQTSVNAAERLGFKMEGVLRWLRALPEGLEGNGVPLREGDPKPNNPGRHTVQLSLCWDDWENGGREHIEKLMAR